MNPATDYELHAECPSLRDAILWHARSSMVRRWSNMSNREKLFAVSYAVRDRLIDRAINTFNTAEAKPAKWAYYVSMEFLIGKSLENNLVNLGLLEECRETLAELGTDLNTLLDTEEDAALGNGGLGRLAACFMDSIATLGLPAIGFGINYDFGLFRQEIAGGQQIEHPDEWRARGTPWLAERSDDVHEIPVYGRVEETLDPEGHYRPRWVDYQTILGIPSDMPIAGYSENGVALLRLFSARASTNFDMQIFNEGDYVKAVEQKVTSETVSKVLYPSERPEWGPILRLMQEYFLVSCSLREILKQFDSEDYSKLPEHAAIQLNDTHPALAVAELMRLLLDEKDMPWEGAWEATTGTLAYTNHTLLPEALEKWPVKLVEELLPRHLQIIYEINRRFLDQVLEVWPEDTARARRMSIIEEGERKQVRMAHLAIVGSHSVNGVAAVHSQLVKNRLVPDFHLLWPERFNNKTNGVTPRRWILVANPGLSGLIREAIGDGWITNLDELRRLEPMADDAAFRERFLAVKRENKGRLAKLAERHCGESIDQDSLVDSQIKRIHEYKRQLLNVLHVVYQYLRITEDGDGLKHPRTFVFSGKAAPGYWTAKQIITLIHAVAEMVELHPQASAMMKVIFVPNYGVTAAETIIPATDLSEQISTAGFEASGTSNMKFAMNGALTIGTLDGANIEMAEQIGAENFFIFGNTVEQIAELNRRGMHPKEFYNASESIRRVMNLFLADQLSPGVSGKFRWVYEKLVTNYDPYYHLADLPAYINGHMKADELYADSAEWARQAILNVARMGQFSADRTIAEYAREIWGIKPVFDGR